LPEGYKKTPGDIRGFMSAEEISRLAKALAELGVRKIRLTGGEPTVRKDFFDILKDMKQNSKIEKVTMTTNGYQLDKIAKQLYETGLNGINISIDSLNKETFKNLTGHDRLPEILNGIKILQDLDFKNIKVNAVLLKGINDSEKDFDIFSDFINDNKIDFRFIELMETGDNEEFFKKNHVPAKVFKDYLEKNNWLYQTYGKDAGPALNYIHPDFRGKFGLIAPYSKDFCKTCNRLRITARGDLRLCLFGNTGTKLRHLLQEDSQKDELVDLITSQLRLKKASHHLELGDTGITPNLSSTGG
jgi:cyclic pyranopterin phosphate synthase|tara:strand:+ start:343 stop:1245 length:903 start_codon:yes stop_codon:yes gene_type:complete